MKKYLTVIASFMIMLCLGGVYAWSIIASELIEKYNFSVTETQIIFGFLIATFPVTMVLIGKYRSKLSARHLGYLSGVLFLSGYLFAGISNGNFYIVFVGIGLFVGIATGLGYWVSLTTSVQWFPERKGLITGIAAAGFGLGAVILSYISENILFLGKDLSFLLIIIGLSYGLIIIIFSKLINQASYTSDVTSINKSNLLYSKDFRRLFYGIFLGTFAGLLIIGSLKLIGEQYNISNHILVLGVSLFALANFSGRLFWGLISDYIESNLTIFLALCTQSISILLLDIILISELTYLILSILIGFGFGGNFVLFAKETAQLFGINKLGLVYPYVFLGYAIAGIIGPLSGGILFDFTGNYTYSIIWASLFSLSGGFIFLLKFLKTKRNFINTN